MEKDDFWYVQRSDGALLKEDPHYPIKLEYYRLWRKSKRSATAYKSIEAANAACQQCVLGQEDYNQLDCDESPSRRHYFTFEVVRDRDISDL